MPQIKPRDSPVGKLSLMKAEAPDRPTLRKFLEDTSLHGCKNMVTRFKLRRLLWVVIFLTAFGGWVYSTVEFWIEIKQLRVNTVFKMNYRRSLDFPSLTICSSCNLDMTRINMSKGLVDMMMATSEWKILRGNVNNSSTSSSVENGVRTAALPRLEDLFLQVQWNGEIVQDIKSMFRQIPEKPCFVFNGKDFQAANGSLKVNYTGFSTGLEVIADSLQSSCPGGIGLRGGLEIYFHSPLEVIETGSPDVLLSPGTSTNIGLRKSQIHFLPNPYESIGDLYCSDEANYSRINCINDCVNERLATKCPCIPGISATDDCRIDTDAFNCYREYKDKISNQAENGELCYCPYPCTLTEFTTDLSFSYFPTDAVSQRLVDLNAIPDIDYARKNLLRFNMNYRDLVVEGVYYEKADTATSIIGTIGGHSGLFLGASIITAIEIIEACLYYCYYLCVRKSSPRHRITVKPFVT